MRIAKRAAIEAQGAGLLGAVKTVIVELQGSLALTGIGHASDKAAIWGLCGLDPETIDPDEAQAIVNKVAITGRLNLLGTHEIEFDPKHHILMRGDILPALHPNGMAIRLYDIENNKIFERLFFSTGGGFIASAEQLSKPAANDLISRNHATALPFTSGAELLAQCLAINGNIYDVVLANEDALRARPDTDLALKHIWEAMSASVDRGLRTRGLLPGGLGVSRRAADLYDRLINHAPSQDLEQLFDWLNVYAMAVNEENAAGGRVVTAPTNGASGLIPALIRYYCAQDGISDDDTKATGKIGRFLLTAAGIGMIYKQRASLSGAEMGCQGEVGVACSMGAAGLCAVWGGTAQQIEHAAEIGMEHNLGLTCDPVGGLVQIPCVERNAIGAVKAANAARMALLGDGNHKVTLDQVIETMRQTGLDMSTKYKETSLGGLAVNVIEC
jgi:L-serine dehydratase